jgi:hypothetical protein
MLTVVANASKTDHQVARELALDFEKVSTVHYQLDDVADVVAGLGLERNDIVQAGLVHAALLGSTPRSSILLDGRNERRRWQICAGLDASFSATK